MFPERMKGFNFSRRRSRIAMAAYCLALGGLVSAGSLQCRAQEPTSESSSQQPDKPAPPPAESSSKRPSAPQAAPTKPSGKKKKDTATQSAPDQPDWDPLRAEKDLEVGQYYMKKGDLDAAIDRFQDAILAKPGYAIPFRYLADAQEKKGLKKQAIKSYQRYLDLYPHAEDGDKVRKKIEKLRKEVEKESK